MGNQATAKKSKNRRVVHQGIVHVSATFNNTIVTITDVQGNVVSWATTGGCGYKGSRKSTPYAAQQTAQAAGEKAKASGLVDAEVRVKGVGTGRESAIRGVISAGIRVTSVSDVTPVPHNGCRPRKQRRV